MKMPYRTPSLICSVLCLAVSLLAPAAQGATTDLPKTKVLGKFANNVMLPMVSGFAASSNELAAKSRAYCQGQARLEHVQAAWRKTQFHWQPLEMMPIGPVSENRLHRHINAWPLRVNLLEPLLKDSAGANVERVRRMGAAGKGLPAVEYLLFEASDRLSQNCNALNALTAQINEEAQGLDRAWREPKGGFGRQLARAGQPGYTEIFSDADQAISDVVNLLIAGLDSVKAVKLGKAIERSADAPALERIESWRSGASLDHIAANLQGFEAVFFGKGKAAIGLDDYLASLDRPGLVRVIRVQLDAIEKALAAVHRPLQTALMEQREAVVALHKEVARLQYLMETEVASALKVDLGFNTNDGD